MSEISALLAAYDEQTRARIPEVTPAGVVHEWDGPLLRTIGFHRGFVETTSDPRIRGAELDALIARQRDYFAARGEAVEWKTRSHDEPADLVDRLLAAGFVPEEPETVLIGEAAELAASPALPDGVTLRQVTARDDLERIAAMEAEVWGEGRPWLAAELGGRIAADPDEVAVFVAEAGSGAHARVVSAAWISLKDSPQFAGLWGGSTLEAWRGRGIYRALVARRARLAVSRDIKYVQVDASENSRPILERLGLRVITRTTPYVWSPER